jgi:lyso-ornithine lipid O-acyltransferase
MALPLIAKIKGRNPVSLMLGQLLFVVRVFMIATSMAVSILLHGIWISLQKSSPWPRWFLAALTWICGIATQTHGRRIKRNVFYASNHHSWVDIPVISGLTGCTFVANDGIEHWPIIGFLCRLNNTIFVSRENRLSVNEQIDELRGAMAGNQPVTVFPEGTTHDGSALLPFKPSLFAALIPPPPGMLVQPVFLTYGRHTARIAWVGEETALVSLWRLLSHLQPAQAKLHFLEPLDPSHYADRKALTHAVRDRIDTAKQASGYVGDHV